MSLQLDIAVEADAREKCVWEKCVTIEALANKAIEAAIAKSGVVLTSEAEVSLLLCDDSFIKDLNKKWRGLDKPTNVLSFPAGGPELSDAEEADFGPLLGDIIIAYETTQREAEDDGKSFESHVTHLIVHGFLHLIGYDHLIAEEAEEMEALERAILADLGIDDPYLGALVQIEHS